MKARLRSTSIKGIGVSVSLNLVWAHSVLWLLNMLLRSEGYINGNMQSTTLEVIVSFYLRLARASLRRCFIQVSVFEENGDVSLVKAKT